MTRVVSISEHQWVSRSKFSAKSLRALQKLDEGLSRSSQVPVFDWSRRNEIKARNYVGVIQAGGVCIEVLPKVRFDDDTPTARSNLAYMLSVAGHIPFRKRDLAALEHHKMPFLEVLISIFAEQLSLELERGIEHSYVTRQDNLTVLKGKLQLSKHIVKNAAHKERFFVSFDEFLPDTWLNRLFKRVCSLLLDITQLNRSRRLLSESVMLFQAVADIDIRAEHLARVHLSRNTQRFSQLFQFACNVILGLAPNFSAGRQDTFSLLFPMEKVFEEFIGRFLSKHSSQVGLRPSQIHLQSRGQQRWLLKNNVGDGKFRLKPDILVEDDSGEAAVIIDTKWKRLGNEAGRLFTPSQSDIYQLFAYAERYSCNNCVLLYPRVADEAQMSYLTHANPSKKLRVEFVDLRGPLRNNEEKLIVALHAIIENKNAIWAMD